MYLSLSRTTVRSPHWLPPIAATTGTERGSYIWSWFASMCISNFSPKLKWRYATDTDWLIDILFYIREYFKGGGCLLVWGLSSHSRIFHTWRCHHYQSMVAWCPVLPIMLRKRRPGIYGFNLAESMVSNASRRKSSDYSKCSCIPVNWCLPITSLKHPAIFCILIFCIIQVLT